jgi:uncharacterized protein
VAPHDLDQLVGADLVLLLLAAPTHVANVRDRMNGITRLEKLLYLADRETDIQSSIIEPLGFQPYNYGPFSRDVYEAVDILEKTGLIDEKRTTDGSGLDSLEEADASPEVTDYAERRFNLTDNGRAVANLLAGKHPDAVKSLSKIKEQYGNMSLRQLIRYVYTRYPESAVNSLIRDQYT